MLIQLLRIKIQELIVSESSASYPGSIGLPSEIIEATGLKLFEKVHVNNLTNGNRIVTYIVKSPKEGGTYYLKHYTFSSIWEDAVKFYLENHFKEVKDDEDLTRIKQLVIPPAWERVWICRHENGHLH